MLNFNFKFNNIDKKKIIYPAGLVICFLVVFGLGIWLGATNVNYYVPQPDTVDFSLFWDAYNKLHQYFIEPGKIDDQKIIYGAIEGMTKTLQDPYTSFFDPDQAKRFQQDLSGSFEGIGVEIGIKKNQLTVIAPLDGTPGQKAGLKSGDLILNIDGKSTFDITIDEAVNLIRGPEGTDVSLTIFRSDWSKSKDIKITRDTIIIFPMEWKILDENIAYVRIKQFGDTLSSDFARAVMGIINSPAEKIILDLRNNPGGYLETSQDIAGWFLDKGQTVVIEDFGQGKEQKIYKAEGNGALANYPIVVLMNEGTASASEILAGCLRDNKKVKLIGTKSFGKGSVQQVVNLNGGSFLKITIAKWLTPKGNLISEIGLDSDIKVSASDDPEKDPQLDKALEIIKTIK